MDKKVEHKWIKIAVYAVGSLTLIAFVTTGTLYILKRSTPSNTTNSIEQAPSTPSEKANQAKDEGITEEARGNTQEALTRYSEAEKSFTEAEDTNNADDMKAKTKALTTALEQEKKELEEYNPEDHN